MRAELHLTTQHHQWAGGSRTPPLGEALGLSMCCVTSPEGHCPLYTVDCSFIMEDTSYGTKGCKCLWRQHSVNQNQPLLSLKCSSG